MARIFPFQPRKNPPFFALKNQIGRQTKRKPQRGRQGDGKRGQARAARFFGDRPDRRTARRVEQNEQQRTYDRRTSPPLAANTAAKSPEFPMSASIARKFARNSSFAGNASRHASSMDPLSPKTAATPSRLRAVSKTRLSPPTVTFASSQSTAPAGAATETARPSTNSVREQSDRTSTRPICGRR